MVFFSQRSDILFMPTRGMHPQIEPLLVLKIACPFWVPNQNFELLQAPVSAFHDCPRLLFLLPNGVLCFWHLTFSLSKCSMMLDYHFELSGEVPFRAVVSSAFFAYMSNCDRRACLYLNILYLVMSHDPPLWGCLACITENLCSRFQVFSNQFD